MFQDKAAGLPLLMVEVGRATESVHVLADEAGVYAALYRCRVNDPATPGDWATRRPSGVGLVPFWTTLCPDAGLPGWPPPAFVFTGRGGPRVMANRMQALADLGREHGAAHEHRDRSGDGYLDFTGKVPLVLTTLERLQQHGPHGPVRQRVAQHREGFVPLLQALADPGTHTQTAYWRRQEQRDAGARRREEAERAAASAELQRVWGGDPYDDDGGGGDGPEEALCATPDCDRPLSEQPSENDEARAPSPSRPRTASTAGYAA